MPLMTTPALVMSRASVCFPSAKTVAIGVIDGVPSLAKRSRRSCWAGCRVLVLLTGGEKVAREFVLANVFHLLGSGAAVGHAVDEQLDGQAHNGKLLGGVLVFVKRRKLHGAFAGLGDLGLPLVFRCHFDLVSHHPPHSNAISKIGTVTILS